MGYEGYVVIHPSHVDPPNDCFTPDNKTIEYWIDLYGHYETRLIAVRSTIRHRGDD